MRYRVILMCLMLCIRIAGFANDNLHVDYIGIERGLSNNAVTCIYQDHQGFMWFGTYDGLNRYDGYSFKIYRNIIGDSNSLRDNHIYSIEEDEQYRLWIGGIKGISVFDPTSSRFHNAYYTPWNNDNLQSIAAGVNVIRFIPKARLLIAGSQDGGLIYFERNELTGKQVPLAELIGKEGSYSVTSVEIDPAEDKAWVFIHKRGLYIFDFKTRKLTAANKTFQYADCIRFDQKQQLWLSNVNGFYKVNKQTGEYSKELIPFRHRVTNLFADKENTIWITSDGGGVWFLRDGSNTPEQFLSGEKVPLVNSNSVYTVYEDQERRKWFGTLRGGINVVYPRINSFRHISLNAPGQFNIVNNFILSFCEDEKSNVWIGTDGAGLRYWDRKRNSYTSFIHNAADSRSISSNFITGILKDSRNEIWLSTWFGGINRIKSTGVFEKFRCFNSQTNQEESNAWLIYEDQAKRIWASTTNNGTLYIFNRSKNIFEVFDENIVNVQCLTEDKAGNLWAGNYTSLMKLDPIGKTHRAFNIGYPVRFIHEDRDKNFWIATEGGGLLMFDRTKDIYKRFTTINGLPSNTILRILEDKSGNLWLSTYNGLCKFNTKTFTCRNFSQSDGLQSNQFSFNAGLALQSGEFLFGGIKGYNVFYPDSIYDRRDAPRIFLTNLKIDNVTIEDDNTYITSRTSIMPDEIKVPFNKALLSLDFVALEYSGADKIKYAYKLDGWDKDWITTNNIRTANYSRLQEGVYTFKVKATNADGFWGEEKSLLKIRVLPPWFRTWWSYCLYLLVLSGAVFLYILYNKRQERLRYEIKLANVEKEKEKELTEKKIAFFTHISHEFRTPLTLIINPIRDMLANKTEEDRGKNISMIYRNARRLLSLVDQLLLFRKVESVDQQLRISKFNLVEVCKEVGLCFNQLAQSRKIDFKLSCGNGDINIYADKEKIEIILFNLVSNSFKYTEPGGQITLTINEQQKEVVVTVQDNGCGIPPEAGNKLFGSFYQANKGKESKAGFGVGLYVSRKLAQAHQGQLNYSSEAGNGTAFYLTLLKGKDHWSNELIGEEDNQGETILHELVEDSDGSIVNDPGEQQKNNSNIIDKLRSDLPTMVIVDDNAEMRTYVRQVFADSFNIYEGEDGRDGLDIVKKESPDIVISDIRMKNMSGIELCEQIKRDPQLAHIPIILLTGSSAEEVRLQGIECGAEDYITKPFNKEIIVAKVKNILKGRSRLQAYFFNAVTLKPNINIPGENKVFIEKCITIVENHLDNPDFNIQTFCREIGMSHPSLYKKVKSVSGLTVNIFVRYLRLRKAAELLINSDKTIVEVAYITGFNDVRYFREQFHKLFGMNPSDYIKKYRKVLGSRTS